MNRDQRAGNQFSLDNLHLPIAYLFSKRCAYSHIISAYIHTCIRMYASAERRDMIMINEDKHMLRMRLQTV